MPTPILHKESLIPAKPANWSCTRRTSPKKRIRDISSCLRDPTGERIP